MKAAPEYKPVGQRYGCPMKRQTNYTYRLSLFCIVYVDDLHM
jgi:hypothetical protein